MNYLSIRQLNKLAKHSTTTPTKGCWLRWIGVLTLAVVLALSTSVTYKYVELHSNLKNSVIETGNLIQQSTQTSAEKPADSYEGRAINLLLMGRDNIDENGRVRVGDSGMGMRNDTTIIMHISRDRNRVQLVSIPRDALVQIPKCSRNDGTYAPKTFGMFNAAFSRGGANGDIGSAAACVINTVHKITGIYIDDFVVVDFAGFRGMVDAVGGVDMCFDKRYADPQYTGLDVGPGCITMDGLTATRYARARHLTNTDGSDVSRIERQQRLLGKLISSVLKKGLWVQTDFANQALKNANMSAGLASARTLLGLAYSLSHIDHSNVVFATAPWETAPSNPNRVLLTDQAEVLWEAIREDRPIPDGIKRKDMLGNIRTTEDPVENSTIEPESSTEPN